MCGVTRRLDHAPNALLASSQKHQQHRYAKATPLSDYPQEALYYAITLEVAGRCLPFQVMEVRRRGRTDREAS